MATWGQITSPMGVYTSKVFDVSSPLDMHVTTINIEKINIYNQGLNITYALSTDGLEWSDWMYMDEGMSLFEGFNMSELYLKYRVEIKSTSEIEKPYLQSIGVNLHPYTSIENLGDFSSHPKIWIRKRNGDGDIALINHFTEQRVEIKNLRNNEEIFMNSDDQELISSLQKTLGIYRFDDHNDEWLELTRGRNYIRGEGDFDIDFRYQSPLIQE